MSAKSKWDFMDACFALQLFPRTYFTEDMRSASFQMVFSSALQGGLQPADPISRLGHPISNLSDVATNHDASGSSRVCRIRSCGVQWGCWFAQTKPANRAGIVQRFPFATSPLLCFPYHTFMVIPTLGGADKYSYECESILVSGHISL